PGGGAGHAVGRQRGPPLPSPHPRRPRSTHETARIRWRLRLPRAPARALPPAQPRHQTAPQEVLRGQASPHRRPRRARSVGAGKTTKGRITVPQRPAFLAIFGASPSPAVVDVATASPSQRFARAARSAAVLWAFAVGL